MWIIQHTRTRNNNNKSQHVSGSADNPTQPNPAGQAGEKIPKKGVCDLPLRPPPLLWLSWFVCVWESWKLHKRGHWSVAANFSTANPTDKRFPAVSTRSLRLGAQCESVRLVFWPLGKYWEASAGVAYASVFGGRCDSIFDVQWRSLSEVIKMIVVNIVNHSKISDEM